MVRILQTVYGYPVTQRFGENPGEYGYPCRPDHSHNGIDFGCPQGTRLLAPDAGKVVYAGFDTSGYGNMVKITHSYGQSVLAHLSEIWVKVGQVVAKGDVVGLSGNTGNSSGPHVHQELRIPAGDCKKAVDPQPYFEIEMNPVDPNPDPGTTPIPEPGQSPDPNTKEVIVQNLNIRLEPTTASNVVGSLKNGEIVKLTDATPVTTGGIVWRQVSLWAAESEDGTMYLE